MLQVHHYFLIFTLSGYFLLMFNVIENTKIQLESFIY